MPFVVESSSATAAQHESNHLYAALVEVLSKLQIPDLPKQSIGDIEDIEQSSPTIDTVDGEFVADIEKSREKSQGLQLEDSSATPVLPGEELVGRLRGGDDPQLLEARPIRLLAPGDEIRLEVGDEAIESDWATFPEALKQLSPQQVSDVCQAIEHPIDVIPEQISSSLGHSDLVVDPIKLTVNEVPQFERSESGAISLNNLYPAIISVQAEILDHQAPQTAIEQQQTAERPDLLSDPNTIEPNTIGVEAVRLPTTSEAIPTTDVVKPDEVIEHSHSLQPLEAPLEPVALPTTQTSLTVKPIIQNLQDVNAPLVEAARIPPAISIDTPDLIDTEPPESRLSSETQGRSFPTAEFPSEEINPEPENQLLPLGEIERVTGQEIGSGLLHDQIIQQSPSVTAHRNASGQFTATQSIKAHVEATEDEVETEAILQAETLHVETQEKQAVDIGFPTPFIDLSAGGQSVFGHFDSFLQHNRDSIDGAISDRALGLTIQPQDEGGFVATNADGQTLSFDGNQATGDASLIAGVSELAQKAIAAALAYNAQAAQECEDIERV